MAAKLNQVRADGVQLLESDLVGDVSVKRRDLRGLGSVEYLGEYERFGRFTAHFMQAPDIAHHVLGMWNTLVHRDAQVVQARVDQLLRFALGQSHTVCC